MDFATWDEPGHIASGLFAWNTGLFYFYPVNPPLTKLVATAPVLLLHPDTLAIAKEDIPGDRSEYKIAALFVRENAKLFPTLLLTARLAGVGWSVLGGWLVYSWSRRLFGNGPGLFSLAVWCFEPNIIAHAHLITADVPSAVAACAAAMAFLRYLRTPTLANAFLAGIVLGIAQACKFTLMVLYPVWLVLWLVSCWEGPRKVGWSSRLAQLALLGAVTLFVINYCYWFSGEYAPLGDYPFVSKAFGGERTPPHEPGNRFAGTLLGRLPLPIPEQYLRGIDLQRRGLEARRDNFLGGKWKEGGWWYYYLYGLGVKVPLGILALFFLALGVAATRTVAPVPRIDLLALTLTPTALLALVSSQMNLQGHTRYALAAFPFAIVLIGWAGAWAREKVWRKVIVGSLLGCAVLSSLAIHPCELSYFNELAGGPNGGSKHLHGSNVDWGQDLWRLKDWLDRHPEAQPLRLAFNGTIDPATIGIDSSLPPFGPGVRLDIPPIDSGPHPGWYAVSIACSHGRAFLVPDGPDLRLIPPGSFEYFQHFQPIARAGYSILIYHISLDEANTVRKKLQLPPLSNSDASS
jgi:4-amino-4-deoxy-L-arabinose transferase-like glycosyltransferase